MPADSISKYFLFLIFFFKLIKNISTVSCSHHSKERPTTDLACSLKICSELGEPCGNDTHYSGFQCYVEDRCLNSTCVPSLGIGNDCNSSFDCILGTTCVIDQNNNDNNNNDNNDNSDNDDDNNNDNNDINNINNFKGYYHKNLTTKVNLKIKKTCQHSFFAEFGDKCKRNSDCLNSLECINGKCSTPSLGCLTDFSCNNDSICNRDTRQCVVTTLKEGECFLFKQFSCNDQNLLCAPKSFMISSIGICKKQIEGSPCLTSKLINCDWNLYQWCKPLNPGSLMGNCTIQPSNTSKSCITQADCNYYEMCKCDSSHSGVGYCIPKGSYNFFGSYCKASINKFLECYYKTNCTDLFSQNPSSCSYRNCPEESECLGTFCIDKMLPVGVCTNRKCKLTLFNTTNGHFKVASSSSFSNFNFNSLSYLIITLILIIIFIII
ncbi:hypothetical protein DDB_G0291119 [Dictyostelium discoideum AX4]|uniref:Dickkopf N-terminal cysteine-rich domain-containing protein n=1 Tax=Dictyostelium discoideum TaxID=44689 RepID=Q54F45_DICDI|nr:hypothetical protein DDB_G0291119 [Dictyostelium discoideum AX4]EAL61884.1 hypothetical protein DDB_G0291119 [Dictyostelium discoideum AX4]|eukprot:XP_635386.1 hypothetical protein DDB_G0291119 [Dictyostelium discoideum AX4]